MIINVFSIEHLCTHTVFRMAGENILLCNVHDQDGASSVKYMYVPSDTHIHALYSSSTLMYVGMEYIYLERPPRRT